MNLTLQEFIDLACKHDIVPVYDTLASDLDTPVTAFLKLKTGEYDFLLESVEGGEKWGRYSFLGTRPRRVYRLNQDVMEVIEADGSRRQEKIGDNPLSHIEKEFCNKSVYQDENLPRFFGGAVGYFAYDMVRHFENIPLKNKRAIEMPDLYFLMTSTVVIFDSFHQVMRVVHCVHIENDKKNDRDKLAKLYTDAVARVEDVIKVLSAPLKPAENVTLLARDNPPVESRASFARDDFISAVNKAKDYILEGDIFQVVPSIRFEFDAKDKNPFSTYRWLRRINPSPYMYYFNLENLQIAGASPEVLVRVEDGKMHVRPIAGTRKRGRDEAHDKELENDLIADPKEQSEHLMLVDLGRNDVGRVCVAGSVKVDSFAKVERYSHVMHLVSHVSGKLQKDKSVFDALRAAFPAGTLSGAPKIRAMEIIEELEPVARGIYGGAIGYIGYSGNADFAIAIRTAVFSGDRGFVQAGAGIVYHSQPELEFNECNHKAGAVLAALRESGK